MSTKLRMAIATALDEINEAQGVADMGTVLDRRLDDAETALLDLRRALLFVPPHQEPLAVMGQRSNACEHCGEANGVHSSQCEYSPR